MVALDISGETGRFNGFAWAADRIVSSGHVYPEEEEMGVEDWWREIADPTAARR